MNSQQAKEILKLCRPGVGDETNPEVQAALELAKTDPELECWWEHQQAFTAAMREKFRQIEPPEGLYERILANRNQPWVVPWWRRPAFLALAASIVLLLCLIG